MFDEPEPLPCAEKLAFDTEAEASATATVAAYRYGGSGVRPYLCQHCHLWHLSSN